MEERTGSFKPVKKKRGSFNAIDALIVLFIIGVVIIFIVSRISSAKEPGEKTKFEYTVTIEAVDKAYVDNINTGERVFDSSSKNFLGTVSTVVNDVPYSTYEYDNESGEIIKITYPDKYNVIVTISSKAQFVEDVGYTVGGCRIAVGQELTLRFPEYVATAYCTGMREVK